MTAPICAVGVDAVLLGPSPRAVWPGCNLRRGAGSHLSRRFAGCGIDQVDPAASKARHRPISLDVVLGVVVDPALDLIPGGRAAEEERRHRRKFRKIGDARH
jgi:hypothetical protein